MTDAAPARKRWPIVLGAVAGGLAAVLGVGLLVLDSVLTSKARAQAAELSSRLGRPVEVDRVAVKLLGGLGVRVSGVRVGAGPDEGIPLVEVGRVEVRAALLRVLLSGGKDVEVRSAEVDGLRVNVIRLADGTTNVERLQRKLAETAAPAPKAPGEAEAGPRDLSFVRVDRAALQGARIAFADRSGSGAKEIAIQDLDVTVTDLRAGRPLDVLVRAAVLAGKRNLELRLHATPLPATLVPSFETVTLRVEPVDLAPLAPFVPASVGLRGGRFEASLDAALGAAVPGGSGPTRIRGGFRATGLAFAGQEGGRALDAELDADVEGDAVKGDVRIGKLRLDVGPAGISGQGRATGLAGGSPRIEGLSIVSHGLDPEKLAAYYPPLRKALGGRASGPIGVALRGSGSEARQALDLEVDLTPVRLDLPGTLAKAAGARMTLAARALGAGEGAQRFEARADLSGVDLRPGGQVAKAPGERLSLSIAGSRRAAAKEETLEISKVELLLPQDAVSGTARVVRGGPPGKQALRLDAELASARLDLDRLLLPAPKGAAGATEDKPPDPKAFAGLSGLATVRVGLLRLRKVDARDVVARIRVEGDEVVVEKGDASALGGTVSAAGTRLRLAHPNEPFQAKLKAKGVELEQALAPFTSKKVVTGRFDGDVDLSGGGREKADLVKTLAGLLAGKIQEGTFHGKDLVAGVAGPLARALPFGGKEMKGGTTALGKELPFQLEFKDGRAELSKPIRIARPDAEVTLSGGFRLDGALDMLATVALSPQTVASITGGRARPSAPIPVSFRLSGPAWSPVLSDMALQPAVTAILKEAGSAALGKAIGVPGGTPERTAQDAQKKAADEARKRIESLFGR